MVFKTVPELLSCMNYKGNKISIWDIKKPPQKTQKGAQKEISIPVGLLVTI